MSEQANVVLRCDGLAKRYGTGPTAVEVLRRIDLTVRQGETVAIVGASGSGKSTLLHCLGGLDSPSAGTVEILGQSIAAMSPKALGDLRNRALGFVYQFHHLLPEFSALENVGMPLLMRRGAAPRAPENAGVDAWKRPSEAILQAVGLAHRMQHAPGELSGGERQRAALARALVTQPACVLADEPTGNLDRANAESMFGLMMQLQRERGTAFVVVTHDTELAKRLGRVVEMRDGVLAGNA
jgi:lipoprotein-releasing system ATP-binding protein